MHQETDLFAVVPAIACDTEGENDGTGREILHFRAIELDDAGRVFSFELARGWL
jgi:hypothetical protein